MNQTLNSASHFAWRYIINLICFILLFVGCDWAHKWLNMQFPTYMFVDAIIFWGVCGLRSILYRNSKESLL